MQKERNKILFIGYIEFPYGMAQVQRQLTMSKILLNAGYDVTVLCRYGIYTSKNSEREYLTEGVFEGIKYKYCSGTAYRPDSFLKRNFAKLKGAFKEFYTIVKLGRKKELSAVFITTNYFYNVVFYGIACKLGGVQSILDNVEYFSNSKTNIGKFEKRDAYLYDRYLFYFIDKIICISDFLVKKAEKVIKPKNILKIPAITEFEKFNIQTKKIDNNSYILYCGSITYFEVIDFVISAFEKTHNTQFLYLITRSNNLLEERIKNSTKKSRIKVFSDIPYEQLITLYNQCDSFVIPLRPNINDEARFPHKISEFCASGRPFISNNFGEVNVYFKDKVNAFLCDEYNVEKYAKKMDELYDDVEKSEVIGKNALELGKHNFSHLAYTDKIRAFINSK